MISSLPKSLFRITLVWYLGGLLVLFMGSPQWAETAYRRLQLYPGVPEIPLGGIFTAAKVQLHLLIYWTTPVLGLWLLALLAGFVTAQVKYARQRVSRKQTLAPRGEFWGVTISHYSLGALPQPTVPQRAASKLALSFSPEMQQAVNLLNVAERALFDQLIELLWAHPEHFAGHGHGVGLLEHTLNVVAEAAPKCTSEFRLPLLAAAAHDIGKLITFQPDGKGGWERRGWHTREGARILVTLPAFRELPPLEQTALLLAVKYDHAPQRMPNIQGKRDAADMAMRIINALAQADKTATAAEKDRNLEKLQPEDLLWQDFVDHFRTAPVVQKGKPGTANQVNNPDGPYVFLYEAPWRDAAVTRMPAEVAAALDLTRRDAGKLAKYTRILLERFRKEGILIESHGEHQVHEDTPLWDIQSGNGEKAVVLRGVIALRADALWKALNYRLGAKSPYPVQILAPTAAADGSINAGPQAINRNLPDVSDGMAVSALGGPDALSVLGLGEGGAPSKPKTRARQRDAAPTDNTPGLAPAKPAPQETKRETAAELQPPVPAQPAQLSAPTDELAAPMASPTDAPEPPADNTSLALNFALAGLSELAQPATGPDVTDAAPADTGYDDPTEPVDTADPLPADAPGGSSTPEPLSTIEQSIGLAIADEAAVAQYPHLALGDKYYPPDAPAVKVHGMAAGTKYKGGRDKAAALAQPYQGRGRRRMH